MSRASVDHPQGWFLWRNVKRILLHAATTTVNFHSNFPFLSLKTMEGGISGLHQLFLRETYQHHDLIIHPNRLIVTLLVDQTGFLLIRLLEKS